MHICFLCNEYPPSPHGGIGTMVLALGRELVARGHRVTVLGVYNDSLGSADDCGVRVIRLPATRLKGMGYLINGGGIRRAVHALHAADPIDLVDAPENGLAMLPRQQPFVRLIRMNGGHRFFSSEAGRRPAMWRSWLESRSFARADALCAVSRYVGERTRQVLNLGGREIRVIYNGIETEKFAGPTTAAPNSGEILFAGTVCEKKGIRQLVEGMPEILQAVPHARLVVAGRDWSDPSSGESFTGLLRRQMAPAVAERVQFLGRVPREELPVLMARASVLCFPSHMEAFSLGWIEGLASGRPVVASCTGPGPEAIEDGVHGLLCDPHSPSSIASAVSRVLLDNGLAARLGAAGRERAQRFSVGAMADASIAYYEECTRAGRRAPSGDDRSTAS